MTGVRNSYGLRKKIVMIDERSTGATADVMESQYGAENTSVNIPRVHTIITVPLLIVCAAFSIACKRWSDSRFSFAPASMRSGQWTAETNALAGLPIHLELPLGADLRLAGLSVAARPDGRSWVVTLHSTVLHQRNPRPQLWLHAYPPGSGEYRIVGPTGGFLSADAGRVVHDGFLMPGPGAFNLYAGVMGADGSYGPAVSLGWVGWGNPDTPEYHAAFRFLQEADDNRAAAMMEQARRDYPSVTLP